MKNLLLAFLLGMTQMAQAAEPLALNTVDETVTRQAVGFSAYSIIPLLVLVIFLVVLGFAAQKIPGYKG